MDGRPYFLGARVGKKILLKIAKLSRANSNNLHVKRVAFVQINSDVICFRKPSSLHSIAACLGHNSAVLRDTQGLARSIHDFQSIRALAHHAVVNNKAEGLNLVRVAVFCFVVEL
jgi:hypothetical protein